MTSTAVRSQQVHGYECVLEKTVNLLVKPMRHIMELRTNERRLYLYTGTYIACKNENELSPKPTLTFQASQSGAIGQWQPCT